MSSEQMDGESNKNELLYDGILRQVLWGDKRDEIMHRLEVNGVVGNEANKIFHRAMSERISTIRGIYWRRILVGALSLVMGVGIFVGIAILTEGFRVFNLLTIIVPSCVSLFGAWKFFGGVIGVLTAGSRNGPLSEID